MPSCSVRSFTDPIDYATSIRGAKADLTVVGSGQFAATITRIDLDRLWMQRFSDNLPRILHSANSDNRAIISFQTAPGPDLIRGGVAVRFGSIARMAKDHSYFQQSPGSLRWGSMSLPVEDLCSAGAAIVGCDLAPPPHEIVATPRPAAMAKLLRLHAAAGNLAERFPETLVNPTVAHGLEQALIHAMVDCISPPHRPADRSAHRRHDRIMRRFHAAISEHSEGAIYIPELCAMVGVPERTLRLCCSESLGMGPKRYLLLRRLNLAHHALRAADANATTVTEVAADFGFWNFGRFSIQYKALYGENPSATLHRPLD
jgi:AraC-like DNA-binding protein